VYLTTQSDIDSINGCTTIYGDLIILLSSIDASNVSPTIFTLPSSLVSVDQSLSIEVLDAYVPTKSFVAPNLARIGYGNENTGTGAALSISAFEVSWNLTTTSFPALTAVGGAFDFLSVNPLVTTLTGFPLLSTVGQQLAGGIYINGSFSGIQLPSLTAVGGGIIISSTDPSFQCPSNIENPKIVEHGECVNCGYITTYEGIPTPALCNSGANPTLAVVTTAAGDTTSTANTATAKPSSTGKTSGASVSNRAGN
jgi:hypothetical protein